MAVILFAWWTVLWWLPAVGEALSTASPSPKKPFLPPSQAWPAGRLPSFFTDPSLQSFAKGTVPLVVVANAIDSNANNDMEDWKLDAQALQKLSFGAAAGVATGQQGIRSGVHQVWLQHPHLKIRSFRRNGRGGFTRWCETRRKYLRDSMEYGITCNLKIHGCNFACMEKGEQSIGVKYTVMS